MADQWATEEPIELELGRRHYRVHRGFNGQDPRCQVLADRYWSWLVDDHDMIPILRIAAFAKIKRALIERDM
jgi:hypothetical protein